MYIYIYGSDKVSAMHPSPLPQITLGEKRRKKEEKEGKEMCKLFVACL